MVGIEGKAFAFQNRRQMTPKVHRKGCTLDR